MSGEDKDFVDLLTKPVVTETALVPVLHDTFRHAVKTRSDLTSPLGKFSTGLTALVAAYKTNDHKAVSAARRTLRDAMQAAYKKDNDGAYTAFSNARHLLRSCTPCSSPLN